MSKSKADLKAEIDSMTYAGLLRVYRFAPPGTGFFSKDAEKQGVSAYFTKRMKAMRAQLTPGEAVEISKEVNKLR